MKKTWIRRCLALPLTTLSLFAVASAEDSIQNLTATVSGQQVLIQWDKLADFNPTSQKGYALQWSQRESDIRNDKPARVYTKDNLISLRKRSFETDSTYYIRVYSYEKIGRERPLYKGSKMLKWTLSFDGTTTSEAIAVTNDVNLSASGATVGQNTSSGFYEFSPLRVLTLDTFADVYWSQPRKISKSEYNGYEVTISDQKDFSNILKKQQFDKIVTSIRLEGLSPEKQYYVKASFVNGSGNAFGTASAKGFKTIKAVDRSTNSRASRNIKKLERKALKKMNIGETSSSSIATSTTSQSSSTSSTSASSSSSSSSSAKTQSSSPKKTTKTPTSRKEIQARISEIYKQIRSLQKELRTLRAKLKTAK